MNSKRFTDYLGTPRPRKVKHVKFIFGSFLEDLETECNAFTDDHPDYKILGVRLMEDSMNMFILTVTYLENAKGVEYTDYEDDSYED